MRVQNNLPPLDPLSTHHCQRVAEFIHDVIEDHGGRIPFAKFMELALYAPGLGYYVAGARKFGAEGDFITAPEISSLYGYCIAKQCSEILTKLNNGVIVEFGAGSGKMAADILQYLHSIHQLPQHYYILEVSPDLQQRQQEYLAKHCPELMNIVTWLQKLPEKPLRGVILANEVLDAMPFSRYQLSDQQLKEFFVTCINGNFQWTLAPASTKLDLNTIHKLGIHTDLSYPYHFEICHLHRPWLASLGDVLQQGVVLLMDYGYPAMEYYHPGRNRGTLACYFRHRVHDNPLLYPGLQDITAHVNFTAIAESAHDCGFEVNGYINQAMFLLNGGILDFVNHVDDEETSVRLNNEIKRLTLPIEMGEAFKIMALSINMNLSLSGFNQMDRRQQL